MLPGIGTILGPLASGVIGIFKAITGDCSE
jgi:hypothetical protein